SRIISKAMKCSAKLGALALGPKAADAAERARCDCALKIVETFDLQPFSEISEPRAADSRKPQQVDHSPAKPGREARRRCRDDRCEPIDRSGPRFPFRFRVLRPFA